MRDSVVWQRTLKRPIHCSGVGLHSGQPCRLSLKPAAADTGIVFERVDLSGARVAARHDLVCDTRLGTTLSNADGVTVSTVEHLMAALWGSGVDNVIVELDGPEVPVMDGSSAPFVFLVDCAGLDALPAPRQVLRVLRSVTVGEDDKSLTLSPARGFSVDFRIQFADRLIGTQDFSFTDAEGAFKADLANARTFGFAHEVAALRAAGLARGGSLDNAVVVDDGRVLNEEGLRSPDEFVRHKVLDCVGDLYLAGARLIGCVEAHCSGHDLNNRLLKALFADPENWSLEPARAVEPADSILAAIA